MVDADDNAAVVVACDPGDDARVWLRIDRVSRADRVAAVNCLHMACSHGAPPEAGWNVTALSRSMTESRPTCT